MDNPKELEGALEEEGAEELAVPKVSEPTEVKPPSVPSGGITEDRLQELLAAQRAELEEVISKGVQSIKDRRIGQLETKVDEALALKSEVEAAGGWDQFLVQRQQADLLDKKIEQLVEARISQGAGKSVQMPTAQTSWQAEWRDESQKILDAAAKSGVSLSKEEYNAAMFNNGRPFNSKGDAYAALNQAILRKSKGESISVAAVATEGGDVAKPPAPPATPKTAAQRFEEAKAAGDYATMEAIQAERWDNVEKLQKETAARNALAAAGLTAEDLIEK